MYLHKAKKKTWQALKLNKSLLLIILILQVLIIVGTVAGTFNYQIKIIKNAQNIITPIQNANFDIESVQQGVPFMQDMLIVKQSYNALKSNLIKLSLLLGLIFFILQAGLWMLSQRMFKKFSLKDLGHLWLKFSGSAVVLFVPYLIIVFYIMKKQILTGVDIQSFSGTAQYLAGGLGILYYLFLVALALSPLPWKKFVESWYRVGIKKIHKTFVTLAINLVLIIGGLGLNYLAIMKTEHLSLMIISVILTMSIMVISRIFWIASIETLYHEKNNN